MSLMILAGKTLHSATRAGLLGLMLVCAVAALMLVVALVSGITWLTANLVTLPLALA